MKTIKEYIEWVKKIQRLDPDLVRLTYADQRTREDCMNQLPKPDKIERELYANIVNPLIYGGLEHGSIQADCTYEEMKKAIINAGLKPDYEEEGTKTRPLKEIPIKYGLFVSPYGGNGLYLETALKNSLGSFTIKDEGNHLKTERKFSPKIWKFKTHVAVRGADWENLKEPYKTQINKLKERIIEVQFERSTKLSLISLLPFLEELVKLNIPSVLQYRNYGGMALINNFSPIKILSP